MPARQHYAVSMIGHVKAKSAAVELVWAAGMQIAARKQFQPAQGRQ
jgi:hypothetical protein